MCVCECKVCVCVTESLISGNRPGREQGGEQEKDVEGWGWWRKGRWGVLKEQQ